MLSDAREPRLMQRREYTDGGKLRARKIGDGQADADGRSSGRPVMYMRPLSALNRGRRAPASAGLRIAAEPADRAVNDALVRAAQEIVAQAQAIEGSRAEVLDHDIRPFAPGPRGPRALAGA